MLLAICLYSQFTQHPNFFGIRVVLSRSAEKAINTVTTAPVTAAKTVAIS